MIPLQITINTQEHETNLLGFPVPSDSKVFLTFIIIHIAFGITCVMSGAVAILSRKTKGVHSRAGKIYYWAMTGMFLTVIITSIMRWPYNIHLLVVGSFAYLFTVLGRSLAKRKKPNWARLHTICMGASCILLATGFYIDNGKNLPFLHQFPQLFFWLFPSAVGIPAILYALLRNPLNRKKP